MKRIVTVLAVPVIVLLLSSFSILSFDKEVKEENVSSCGPMIWVINNTYSGDNCNVYGLTGSTGGNIFRYSFSCPSGQTVGGWGFSSYNNTIRVHVTGPCSSVRIESGGNVIASLSGQPVSNIYEFSNITLLGCVFNVIVE